MRKLALVTAAVVAFAASSSSAALSISLEKGTSPNVDPAVADVYFIKVASTTANVPLFASAVSFTMSQGSLLFPDGDANGGLSPLSTTTTNLNLRNSPDGTWAAIPGSIAYIATNNDNVANSDPNDDTDFSTGRSGSVNLISTRTSSYVATSNPFTLGALVVTKGGSGHGAIQVSSDGNDSYQLIIVDPEPTSLMGLAMAGVAAVRRRK